MDWWRAYHGLCTDPKLHRVARSIHVSRGLVVAGWVAICETASAHEPRGSIGELDAVSLAFLIDVKPHVATKILDGFRAAKMLDDAGNVVAWTKRQRQSDFSGWPLVRKTIFDRDGYVCAYCGDTDGPFEIDHKHPRSRGGTNEHDNLTVACRTCNRSKRAMTVDEWLERA
jgi:5-methylcytosine-specific restriction endonuclease McrA